MAGSSQAIANIVTNERVIVSSVPDNRENTPPMVNEADLDNLNNE